MDNPIIAPERAAFVREVFEQIRNQLEAIDVNPTYFCAWIRYLEVKENAMETVMGEGPSFEVDDVYTVVEEAEGMVDALLNDGYGAIQQDMDEALAIGRCLDPDFGHDFLSYPII